MLGFKWRKVEDSGGWSLFRRWLVIPPVQTNQFQTLISYKTIYVKSIYMLHNTLNSNVCQVFVPNNETKYAAKMCENVTK